MQVCVCGVCMGVDNDYTAHGRCYIMMGSIDFALIKYNCISLVEVYKEEWKGKVYVVVGLSLQTPWLSLILDDRKEHKWLGPKVKQKKQWYCKLKDPLN